MEGKHLLLLRHAKSSWRDASLSDHDRPLNRRGRTAAIRMGEYLVAKDLLPDLVLCSTAKRARTTWTLAARAFGDQAPKCAYNRELYHAAPSDLLFCVQAAADSVQWLLVVGHNPGIELLAQRLSGPGSDEDAFEHMTAKYPTAGLAHFSVAAPSWSNLEPEACSLEAFVIPNDFMEAGS